MDDLTKTIATTVSSAIEAQAKAQFLAALGGTDVLIDKFIQVAANYTVERNYRKVKLLDATIEDAVKKAVNELVEEMFAEHREQIKKELASRLRSESKDIAAKLVDHAIGAGRRIHIQAISREDD